MTEIFDIGYGSRILYKLNGFTLVPRTVPYADYADASDTRPQVDYRIYVSETVYADVKGGETLEIENGNLVINKDKADEQTATSLYSSWSVTVYVLDEVLFALSRARYNTNQVYRSHRCR